MALDATVGGTDANAYLTVSEATALLQERLDVEPWYTELEPEPTGHHELPHRRAAALMWATQLLEQLVRWRGVPVTTTQALSWPQQGQCDARGRPVPLTEIPPAIKQATVVYALELLQVQMDEAGTTETGGIKRKRIGGVEIEYHAPTATTAQSTARAVVPSEVKSLLKPYGIVTGGVVVPLVRA